MYWCCIMTVCYVSCVLCAPRGRFLFSGSVVSGSVGRVGALELLRNILKKRSKTKPKDFTRNINWDFYYVISSVCRYLFLCAPKQLAYYYKSNLKFRTFEISNYGIPHFDQQRTTPLFDYNIQYTILYLYLPNTHPLHSIIFAYCLRGNSLLIVVSTVRIKFETVPRSIARATVQQHEHEWAISTGRYC